jgi:hypothetical protein
MKSVSIRVALLTIAFASPALMLAGGQPAKVRMVTKADLQSRAAARAINQGKGSGISRRQDAVSVTPAVRHIKTNDTAFTK